MVQKEKRELTKSSEFRCLRCGKLLARADQKKMAYEIKCVRCGMLNPIFKSIEDQVIITDHNGVILYANPLVEVITGYSLHEVLGKKPSLWGGQMPKEFYVNMWHILKTKKKSLLVTVRNRKKNGKFYNAKLHISPVFGVGKEIKMFVGIERVID